MQQTIHHVANIPAIGALVFNHNVAIAKQILYSLQPGKFIIISAEK